MHRHRVAVTGIGAVTPIGTGAAGLWEGVLAGKSAIRRVTRFDPSQFRSQMAAELDDEALNGARHDRRNSRLDRFSLFAVIAAGQALEDASLAPSDLLETDTAVYLGSALGGIAYGEEQHELFMANGIKSVAPGLALSVFSGAGATNVSIEFGLRGPAISNANSCAAGAVAIGEAFRLLRNGGADVVLAGGAEAPLAPLSYGSFSVIKAMSRRNEDPERSCRPFDRDRDGFVMGEGAAVLVLETWEHAVARGAVIQGEVLGYASTNDAHHMTVPLPDGREAARAIVLALRDAGIPPEAVDYINAHATGTALGDAAEAAAISTVFGDSMPPVSGTKPLHGHALGASPAIEAAITILAMRHRYIPGTGNLNSVAPDCMLNHVRDKGRTADTQVALSNSFGFGGINAALVLGHAQTPGRCGALIKPDAVS
jgi:3-oxoacyl-[acyl-carrier-protein] synthase II